MKKGGILIRKVMLVIAVSSGLLVFTAGAKSSTPSTKPPKKHATPVHYGPGQFTKRAKLYYRLYWGVDSLQVRYGEQGEIVRFSYRVINPKKAATLNNVRVKANLIDPGAGVSLVVPHLPFMGLMRAKNKPQAGKTYWIGFSNKGRFVKPGDHVNVVVGMFHADGLVVE